MYQNGSVLFDRSIKFLSSSSYYDYGTNETVTFEVNGKTAQICYDLECQALRR